MDLSNIYYVYRLHPHGTDDLHHQLVAKFLLTKDHFEVLEDHTGQFEKLAAKTPGEISASIHALSRSMYYKLVNLQDLHEGKHPEFIKEHVAEPTLGPESRFEYHRVGMPEAQHIEFHAGKAYIDGHPLEDQDLQLLLDNVQQGHATLSYRQSEEEAVQKAEEGFMSLTKVESGLESALASLREAVKAGHVDAKHLKAITGEIFTDSMVRSMGNKKAYLDFLSRPKQGVHIHIDGNSFGLINKTGRGFEAGNDAIRAMGGAIREAADTAVGRKDAKTHRVGGDEFRVFVPTYEHAALFARHLRNRLEAIPPIDGKHQLSVSMGFGHTPDHAELALINAKEAKKASGKAPGQEMTHAASQIPGYEGHVPTGPDQLHLQPLPKTPEAVVQQVPHILPPGVSAPEKPKLQSTGSAGASSS